ncbi:hypothetical protein [Oceanicoccus sagamiensis]|uniref:Uncharacterized protein n=1 Tax=Oceanicoccus sagamiensis TaxID=716816 RepID=A0A1X9NJU4_9GAMM|nr:hypothetical protein [Oceanicoccus sagamiensis]ARN75137.1 hypothetical protein BST96_14035 [Oceanicoccus sagamiensis]
MIDSDWDEQMLLYLSNKLPKKQRLIFEQALANNTELNAERLWQEKIYQAVKGEVLKPAPLAKGWQQLQQQLGPQQK